MLLWHVKHFVRRSRKCSAAYHVASFIKTPYHAKFHALRRASKPSQRNLPIAKPAIRIICFKSLLLKMRGGLFFAGF
jgi:hypothetical protein